MERLTIRNSDGSVSQPTRTSVEQVFYRLAAYEDTGFEPEQIAFLASPEGLEMTKIMKSVLEDIERGEADVFGVDVKRIDELAEAEKEGRLMVLPCKIGQDVYFFEFWGDEICPATIVGIEVNKHTPQCMLWLRIEYTSATIGTHEYCVRADMALGKIIFLTREEAEAALAAQKGVACEGNPI